MAVTRQRRIAYGCVDFREDPTALGFELQPRLPDERAFDDDLAGFLDHTIAYVTDESSLGNANISTSAEYVTNGNGPYIRTATATTTEGSTRHSMGNFSRGPIEHDSRVTRLSLQEEARELAEDIGTLIGNRPGITYEVQNTSVTITRA